MVNCVVDVAFIKNCTNVYYSTNHKTNHLSNQMVNAFIILFRFNILLLYISRSFCQFTFINLTDFPVGLVNHDRCIVRAAKRKLFIIYYIQIWLFRINNNKSLLTNEILTSKSAQRYFSVQQEWDGNRVIY